MRQPCSERIRQDISLDPKSYANHTAPFSALRARRLAGSSRWRRRSTDRFSSWHNALRKIHPLHPETAWRAPTPRSHRCFAGHGCSPMAAPFSRSNRGQFQGFYRIARRWANDLQQRRKLPRDSVERQSRMQERQVPAHQSRRYNAPDSRSPASCRCCRRCGT